MGNSADGKNTPIKQSRKNLIPESPALPDKNTFNNYITHSYDKEKHSADEQTETEWDAEQGEKDSEEWEKSKQRKLNEELLDILKSINCYAEVYNFYTDLDYDRPGTANLKKFLEDHKDEQDLKVVLDLKRGESETTILHNVANFNIAAVCLLLEAGADPNIKDKEGKTPLYYAVEGNCTQAVIMLLERGSDINAQDNKGKTPLHYTADVNCTEAVEYLLKAGADPNIKDEEKRTPLYYAAEESYEDVVIKLLDEQAKVDIQDKEGNTPLHSAARRGDINIVELLIEKNPDINLKNKNGDTSLHLAFNSRDTRVPESILGSKIKGNIDFNIRDNKGDTPLLSAASLAQANVLREILKQGADIKCVNSEGNTALHYATYNSYTGENCKTTKSDILAPDNDPLDNNSNDYSEDTPYKCVNELIYAGIEVNAKNNYDQTPLFFATEANNINVTERLLEKGADIKVQDKNGYTALHYAIKIRELEMLKKLLPCKVNYDGVATEEVDTEKAKEILSNIRDQEGNTLLHHATKYGCSSGMLSFLVENGVDINAKNKNGVAPIHIAAKYGHTHLIDFFIKNEADINVQCGNFTKSEIDITEKNFINVQDRSGDASSVIDVKNDTNYKDAPPISIAVENSHENAAGKLLSRGVKVNISDNRGWTPIYIAIRTACDKNCEEEEREKAYRIIEKLAIFSNIEIFKSKNQIITKIKELLTGRTEESFLVQVINERIRKILEDAIRSREGGKLPNAPVNQYAPSAPPLDDDFYNEIGSYVKDIPDLKLYPDLSGEFKELEKSTVNMNISIGSITLQKDISTNRAKLENLDDDSKKLNDGTSKNQSKSKTDLDKECSNENPTRDIVKHPEQKIKSASKIRLTFHDREKLNKFSDKVAKSKDIAELNQVVSEALSSGVRLNFLNNSFTDVVMQRIQELKKNSKISSNIICNLVSRGADINQKSYEKINQELEEIFKDHKTNIQKAYLEANKRINDFHEAVANATTGKIEFIEIDNTTFYLEYSADSTVDVAKAIEAARGLGLYDGNITFGGNIVKIGESAVEIETNKGIRNYTDLSDNGDVIITFQTSLGKLDIRLYNSTQYEDFIEVEVCNPERFNQLVDIKEEIGKNCLLGGYSVCNAIKQGYFERSGKFQSSETINCKRPESSETVSFVSQNVKRAVEGIMKSISSADIKNAGEESLVNIIEGQKTNESFSRGM